MRTKDLAAVAAVAAGQWGLVTVAQAAQAGVTRMQMTRMLEAGVLERVVHGVYATPGVSGDELTPLRAVWLALQPDRRALERLGDLASAGVVSHASAARLHRIGDLLADEYEITLPHRYQASRSGLRVHRADLSSHDVTIAQGLPVTTPARTIADLLNGDHDLEHVGQVAADAVRTGLTTPEGIAEALRPFTGRHGAVDRAGLVDKLLRAGGAHTGNHDDRTDLG